MLDVAKGLPSELPGKSSSYTKAANKAATELKALSKQINDAVSRTEKLTANSESVQQELQSSVLANTANWDEQFSTKYGELSDKADSATELLQVVGAGALSQQYVNERSEQSKQDRWWSGLGFISLVAILLIGIATYVTSGANGITWDEVPGRLLSNSPLIGALTAIATVSFRRAGHIRRREERASRIVNELRILGAFTDNLPERLRYAVLAQITPRYFVGGGTEEHQATEATGLGDLMPQITELGTDIKSDSD